MKKRFIFLLFMVCLYFTGAQGVDLIRFNLDLESLSSLSQQDVDLLIEEENLLVLDGILSSVMYEDDKILLTLLNGKWEGTESVQTYQAKIELDEAAWADVFPIRPPRNPGDEIIYVNSYLLVLGRPVSYSRENGQLILTIAASDLRVITQ